MQAGNLTFGATLMGTVAPDDFITTARRMEEWGYDYLWVTDSSLHARYAYAYLTLAAVHTERMQLGTNCTYPLGTHPAIAANAMATINELSGGRGILGIGAGGGPTTELGFTKSAKVTEVEAMAVLAGRLFNGERVTVQDAPFEIAEGELLYGLGDVPPPKVYLTASGPRMLELAGRVADGVLMCCGAFEEGLEFAVSHVQKGAETAGRDLDDIDLAWQIFGTFEHDPAVARRVGAMAGAMFANAHGRYCRMAGISDDAIAPIRSAYVGARHFTEARRAHALVTDAIVDKVTVSGGADVWRERLALADRFGIRHIEVFPLGDIPAVLEGLADEVLAHAA